MFDPIQVDPSRFIVDPIEKAIVADPEAISLLPR